MSQQGKVMNPRQHPLSAQARALGIILREEFDAPFTFYDAATGAPVPGSDSEFSAAPPVELDSATVLALVADDRARVTLLGEEWLLLTLVLSQSGKPALVGAAQVRALAATGPNAGLELTRMQKWLQAVADRLRAADQPLRRRPDEDAAAQATAAWEAILTLDLLIRRLRIHKDPEKNQRRILETAFGLLNVQALVWVPRQPEAPVLIQGDPGLAPSDCRQLAAILARSPELQASAPLLCNQVQTTSWGARFPHLASILAFPVTDGSAPGWVLALNKCAVRSEHRDNGQRTTAEFRRGDAALLTPFVALLELHLRGSGRYQELKDMLVGLTRSLTAALDAKDPYTYGHSERVGRIAVELGRELGLGDEELGDIYLAGLLHDVGKIGIRDSVLCKEGPLTAEEYEHIKQHVTIGYTILSDLRQIRNLLPGVLYHHERVDGRGYPDGLEGDAIPLMGRILAVADAYDAMSTTRPYRDAMPCRRVEEVLTEGAGTQWDRRVVEAFLRCRKKVHAIRQRGVGESLRLAIDGALRTITAPARCAGKSAIRNSKAETNPKHE